MSCRGGGRLRSGEGERDGGDRFSGSVEWVGYASGGGGVGRRTAESMVRVWSAWSQRFAQPTV